VHHRSLEPFFMDAQRLAQVGSWTTKKGVLTPSSAMRNFGRLNGYADEIPLTPQTIACVTVHGSNGIPRANEGVRHIFCS